MPVVNFRGQCGLGFLSCSGAYTPKDALLTVRKHTIGYTEAQAKIIRATTNYPQHGVPFVSVTDRFDLAKLSFNDESFEEITEILTKRLSETTKWRRVLKAVIILNYCLQEGSPKFETYCRLHHDLLDSLQRFHYVFEENTDRGVLVRKEARKLVSMLDDPTNLGRIRQHSASLRRQQQRQTPHDRPKQEKKSSIRRQLTKYREMAFKSRNAIMSDNTQRVDLESDIGPVSVWQMIRAAITNTDSTLQTTVEDCKEIARQTSSPADFMIILEAFIECLAADQEMHRWGQVLRAMILLRVCINNVSEEVAAEFQDDPYVANILNGFDLRWFHDGPAGPNNVTPDAREMPTANVPIGATGDLKMHLPSYDEVPHLQVRNSTLEGYLLEQANTLPNEPEADPIPHATANNTVIVPPHTNSETLNIHPTGRYRPLPLPPTVWDRLHHAAVEWDSTSIATGLGQEPTSQTQIRQHVPPISQNTTRRPLPTPPVVLVDFTLADLYLPPYSPPPPNYDISYHGDHLLPNVENTVGSTELVNHPEEQLNVPISSVWNELDDFEYIDDNRNIDEEDEESSSQLAESDDSLDEVAAEPDDQAELMEDIST
ncbi:hypothetical protein FRC02_006328, partial [Tulasnella sp. 418]